MPYDSNYSNTKLRKLRPINNKVYRQSYPGMPLVGQKYLNDNTIQGNIQNRLLNKFETPFAFDYQSSYNPVGFTPRDRVPLASNLTNLSKNTRQVALQYSGVTSNTRIPKVNPFTNKLLHDKLLEELQRVPITSFNEKRIVENITNAAAQTNPPTNPTGTGIPDYSSDSDEELIDELDGEGFFDFIKPAINIAKSLIPGLGSVAKSAVTAVAKDPKIITNLGNAAKETINTAKEIKDAITGPKPTTPPTPIGQPPTSDPEELKKFYSNLYHTGKISLKAYTTLLEQTEALAPKPPDQKPPTNKPIGTGKLNGSGTKKRGRPRKFVTGTGVDDVIKDIETST